MRILRIILAFATPEFRELYETDVTRDFRIHFAEKGSDRRDRIRAYADLFSAILEERIGMMLRHVYSAFRSFAGTPGVTAVMIGTLAFGIGANIAAFSIMNGILLR